MGGGESLGKRNQGTWNLPYPENVRKREHVRYFHCGRAYSPEHHFPEKKLRVITLAEDEESSDGMDHGLNEVGED